MSYKNRKRFGDIKPSTYRLTNLKIVWYIFGSIVLFLLTIILVIIIPNENPLKSHVIIHYLIFVALQSYAMITSKFSEKGSIIDVPVHIYGGFAFYLIFKAIFDFDLLNNIFFSFLIVGIAFELFELVFELILRAFAKTKRQKISIETISEPFPNIIRDLISDIIGITIGFFYVLWIVRL